MGTIWLVSLSVFGVSILGARWIKKHLSPIQKLLLLVIFIGLYKYDLNVTSPDYPDWLNIILLGLFALPYGSAFLYFVMEFVVLIADDDKTSKNSRNNRNESIDVEYQVGYTRWNSTMTKDDLATELRLKISEMERERNRLDMSNWSHEKYERYCYLSDKINEYIRELQEIDKISKVTIRK